MNTYHVTLETFEYNVTAETAFYFEYGYSDTLSEEEERAAEDFYDYVIEIAKKDTIDNNTKTFTFSYSDETNFCRDDVSGLMANCYSLAVTVLGAITGEEKYIGLCEFRDFGEFHIVRVENFFIGGSCSNCVILKSDEFMIDPYFSDDKNLESFIDELTDKYGSID